MDTILLSGMTLGFIQKIVNGIILFHRHLCDFFAANSWIAVVIIYVLTAIILRNLYIDFTTLVFPSMPKESTPKITKLKNTPRKVIFWVVLVLIVLIVGYVCSSFS